MDAAVLAALARWPNVPHVYGWLRLDRRGQWRLRDEIIEHRGLTEFIARNYAADEHGNWFFQNGPQRVFVALDYTPWIVRIVGSRILRHDGMQHASPDAGFLDEEGSLLIAAGGNVALLDDRDLPQVIDRIRATDGAALGEDALEGLLSGGAARAMLQLGPGGIPLTSIRRASVGERFGFNADPQPAA